MKYTPTNWHSDNYFMQIIYVPGGGKRWQLFRKFQENPEIHHYKEFCSFETEAEAFAKWEELTGRLPE